MKFSLLFYFIFCLFIVDSANAFRPTYDSSPRPGFMAEEILLLNDSKWDFAIGDVGVKNGYFPYKINFGYAPESELSGVNFEKIRPKTTKDIVWYRREFKLPADWKGALLTLEGVDYETEVFINDELVASHKGAYAPFEVDISRFIQENIPLIISLRVQDDRLARDRAVGKQERRPYEGVIFYGNSTGAWKNGFIRKINPDHYLSRFIHQTNSSGRFTYRAEVAGNLQGPFEVQVSVRDRTSKSIVGQHRAAFRLPAKFVYGDFFVGGAKKWSPDSPTLYDVEMVLLYQGKAVELMRSYAGFSDFTQKNGHFYLNQMPFYLRGVLNQMVYPKGLYSPESPTDNAHDIAMIRKHGFNFQRVHQTTPRWRDIYDMENGVMVNGQRLGVGWALEMPSARDLRSPTALANFKKEWKEIIEAYGYGHPGLFYFVSMNEDWGLLEDPDHWSPATDAQREAVQLDLLKTTLEAAPNGSLVSPGDGWRQITGIKNGAPLAGVNPSQLILSAHDYRGSAEELISTYASIPVNAPAGTAMPRNGKELILTGFDFPGNKVAPMMGEMGGKSYAPPGIGNVFGYGHVYRDLSVWTQDALAQFKSLGELKIMRGGYVYTQVRDAGFKPHRPPPADKPAGELNGFLSADGKPKADPSLWYEANRLNQKAHDKNRAEFESLK